MTKKRNTQKMAAVLTGDVIASRKNDQSIWQPRLKQVLSDVGKRPYDWDLYRGDGFQLLLPSPGDALRVAMRLRAGFKSVKGLDMRIAIGVGEVSVREPRIGESNGSAFVRAGQLIDELDKDDVNLGFISDDPEFDAMINASLSMASALIDRWLPNYASASYAALKNPEANQAELGRILGVAQNTVSERLARANYRVLVNFEQHFSVCIRDRYGCQTR